MAYNQGNPTRQTIAEILAGSLSEVNELFVVETSACRGPLTCAPNAPSRFRS